MSGWTVETLAEHQRALRKADLRFAIERDRRYAEVASEREKALKIKETADLAALELAREIQTYKDEKANELRSQIERERGSYVTRGELTAEVEKILATLKPLSDYVTGRQAATNTQTASRTDRRASNSVLIALAGVVVTVIIAAVAVIVAVRG